MNKVFPLLTAFLMAAGMMGCASEPTPKPNTANDSALQGPNGAGNGAQNKGEGSVQVDDRIAKACSLPTAYFAFDSSRLDKGSQPTLDAIATCFSSGPLKGRGMMIVGHADPRGELEYNFALGHKRASSVAQYIQRRGVSAGKIGTSSKGELDATGDDESGWAKDRRVQVLLVD
ncbi:OmpA family protein [Chondromyces crocatus]|uniref:OmpA-family exported protein n=1 Tax=Chondromyces crocatus TaxID=52 RepID=A0A0K1EAQ6_CHOCO|nr:OmpA family protein [Chondromyces crocatus]AKT37966.1 ompA-family exported protein [Chondromyces crocatus]